MSDQPHAYIYFDGEDYRVTNNPSDAEAIGATPAPLSDETVEHLEDFSDMMEAHGFELIDDRTDE